ncbi:unnamed protein product [Vitrella brassicaformis CCMP3155]|uniref:Pseudouridine synthase RsuA/RluA-like domain-containing protein n=1 Tax=Vitrella brassicaformis (strain CCMP3155) TaxID=1169540 RepID=A0A0G4EXS7_VITBC|nr:unnamed protein product [Vitrella brassicaformis CCMP3155]|eukprot:CEM03623.1 unnamed protein product [Vitrella brassicaformis CCMP3155]
MNQILSGAVNHYQHCHAAHAASISRAASALNRLVTLAQEQSRDDEADSNADLATLLSSLSASVAHLSTNTNEDPAAVRGPLIRCLWALARLQGSSLMPSRDEWAPRVIPLTAAIVERLQSTAEVSSASWDGRDVANLVWSMGRVAQWGRLDSAVKSWAIERAADACRQSLSPSLNMKPLDVSNVMVGIAKLSPSAPGDADRLDGLYSSLSAFVPRMCADDVFNEVQLTDLAWSLARLQACVCGGEGGREVCEAVMAACERRLGEFGTKRLVTLMWSFAHSQHPVPASLIAALQAAANRHAPSMAPRSLSNALWAMARLVDASISPPSPSAIAEWLEGMFPDDSACSRVGNLQDRANTMWALGALGSKIAAASAGNLHTFNHQMMLNLLWGYASLGYAYRHDGDDAVSRLYVEGAGEATMRIRGERNECRARGRGWGDPNSKDNVTMVWTLAKAGLVHEEYLDALEAFLMAPDPHKNAATRLEGYDTKSLVGLATGCVRMRQQGAPAPHPLVDALATVLLPRVAATHPTDLSKLVGTYGPLPPTHRTEALLSGIAQHLLEKHGDVLPRCNAFDLVTLPSAYVRASYGEAVMMERESEDEQDGLSVGGFRLVASQLLCAVDEHILNERSLDEFDPMDISTLAWTHSALNVSNPSLFTELTSWITPHLPCLPPTDLAILLHSFAALSFSSPTFFARTAELLHTHITQHRAALPVHKLVGVAWSVAASECEAPMLLDRIEEIVLGGDGDGDGRVVDSLDGSSVSRLAWAYGRAGRLSEDLWKALKDNVMRRAGPVLESGTNVTTRHYTASSPPISSSLSSVQPLTDSSLCGCPALVDMTGEEERRAKDVPRILYESPECWVVYKPPHWSVLPSGLMRNIDSGREGEGMDQPKEMVASSDIQPLHVFLGHVWGSSCDVLLDGRYQHGIAHRLDSETSGALLVAKSPAMWMYLRLLFDAQQVGKEYVCLTHGRVPPGIQWATERLKTEQGPDHLITSVRDDGRVAATEFECLGHFHRQPSENDAQGSPEGDGAVDTMSLVRVKLHTGRTHQIRVHLAHKGFPLVGDAKYGRKDNGQTGDRVWCPRMFLHFHSLRFRDTQDRRVEVTCPLPDDLREVLRTLTPVQ